MGLNCVYGLMAAIERLTKDFDVTLKMGSPSWR